MMDILINIKYGWMITHSIDGILDELNIVVPVAQVHKSVHNPQRVVVHAQVEALVMKGVHNSKVALSLLQHNVVVEDMVDLIVVNITVGCCQHVAHNVVHLGQHEFTVSHK